MTAKRGPTTGIISPTPAIRVPRFAIVAQSGFVGAEQESEYLREPSSWSVTLLKRLMDISEGMERAMKS